MQYRYIYAINAHKLDEIIDAYTEDITEEGLPKLKGETRTGKKLIEKFLRSNEGGLHHGEPLHNIVAQPVISVEGDKAKGYWIWLGDINDRRTFTSARGDEVMLALPMMGRYDMEYKRVDGKWKISYVKFTSPWP